MADKFLVCTDGSISSTSTTSQWFYCANGESTGYLHFDSDGIKEYLSYANNADPADSLVNALNSMSHIDPVIVSQIIGYFLAVFIIGFSAGSLVRYMKKA